LRFTIPLLTSLLLLGVTERSGLARTTVLLIGVQYNGAASERIDQAIAARIKKLGDTSMATARTPIGAEYLGCDEAKCFEPLAKREPVDFIISGRITSSEHARLAHMAVYNTATKEVLADESGCQSCQEKAIIEQAASMASSLLDRAVSAAPSAPATLTPAVAPMGSPVSCPVCPVCVNCPKVPSESVYHPLPRWRQGLAGVLGIIGGGAFAIAVTASFVHGLERPGDPGHYNGNAFMGVFYPLSAAALLGMTLTLTIPEHGAK
jgi:hypothetical protein